MVRKSETLEVESPNVNYTPEFITSKYSYETTQVKRKDGKLLVRPIAHDFTFRTERAVPKVGMMLVGWGGNNGSTVTAGILANKYGITWNTKEGVQKPNYYGSISQASTVRLGSTESGEPVYVPMKDMLPMVSPNDLVIGGWDINDMNLGDAMKRAKVLDYDLQRQLYEPMRKLKPLPSIYMPDFIAANQGERANNVLTGSPQENLETIRKNIRDFKEQNKLDKVIVVWTANTERFAELRFGLNDTAASMLDSIKKGDKEIAPSSIFAVASILEGCPYINGSPQNTFVPGLVELAVSRGVYIGGDDFKSGQTKLKSVLVDFLVSAGIKPASIVSYNHLGNNDGKNLSAPRTFRSKEISKSNVVDDMVSSNPILYPNDQHPDHCVVIKYVPYVGDSKRAMDEYVSEIFLGGKNTISIHNTCEDSLLAAPLIIDLVVLTELFTRIKYKTEDQAEFQNWHSVLSVLSYLLKAPMVPPGTPVVNALAKQRACIENILRACLGLKAEDNMLLEYKLSTPLSSTLDEQPSSELKTPDAGYAPSLGLKKDVIDGPSADGHPSTSCSVNGARSKRKGASHYPAPHPARAIEA